MPVPAAFPRGRLADGGLLRKLPGPRSAPPPFAARNDPDAGKLPRHILHAEAEVCSPNGVLDLRAVTAGDRTLLSPSRAPSSFLTPANQTAHRGVASKAWELESGEEQAERAGRGPEKPVASPLSLSSVLGSSGRPMSCAFRAHSSALPVCDLLPCRSPDSAAAARSASPGRSCRLPRPCFTRSRDVWFGAHGVPSASVR